MAQPNLSWKNWHLSSIFFRLNSPFGPVEVAFIGQRGHGKSALIEALAGQLLSHVSLSLVCRFVDNCQVKQGSLFTYNQDGATKRPIHYQFVNNADILPSGSKINDGKRGQPILTWSAHSWYIYSGIKCVIQYDALLRDHNIDVPLNALSKVFIPPRFYDHQISA